MSKAIISSIESVEPIEGADNIVLATTLGYKVIVGNNVTPGTLGVLFLDGTQLSEEYASKNDLVRRIDPDTGVRCGGGFFDSNRRVRTTKIRGQKSEAFFNSLESLSYTGYDISLLHEGAQFDELNGRPICCKYISRLSKIAGPRNSTKQRVNNKRFPRHLDTAQLNVAIKHIPEGSILYLTEKLHGTSSRFGHILSEEHCPTKLQSKWNSLVYRAPVINRFYNLLTFKGPKKSIYGFELGTRNVIITDHANDQTHHSPIEFRWNCISSIKGLLRKGEIIYGEIVGFMKKDMPIMANHIINSTRLKELPNLSIDGQKQYPSTMAYSYGVTNGDCRFYVYRICQTDIEGNIVDLTWPQVKSRATELGLETVPELYPLPIIYTKETMKDIVSLIESLQEGPSLLDRTHIREGVAIRVESSGVRFLKAKSFTFKVLEGFASSKENHLDIEDAS